MSVTLDRGAFRAWLAGQTRKAEVGRAANPDYCPIATYCKDAFAVDATVSDHYIEVGANVTPLPSWAAWFVYVVDTLERGTLIPAWYALGCLDQIPNEATT